MLRPRLTSNPDMAIVLGVGAFVLGAFCLYDAFEGRGRKAPLLLRPFLPW
jgi:hypothetical protein